ncbi:MAG: cob(I)yrinic acid a,c-diamide adenosyltransferase [Candidatus Daviesbacteria bacterium]|nr:cob(I)yrinic acid a,c-diamide adenosyltransferase [Candidatus Daviesbacteria bacterium]
MNKEKGLVILYTGEGKGKTTAALGLVLRAVGHKKKCLVVQFGKASFTGELEAVKKLKTDVKFIQGGKGFVKILGDKLPLKEHKKAAKKTFDILYKEIISGKWNVAVADEIIGAVSSGLLPESLVVKLITDKPEKLDLVLTGHHASKKLIGVVDLVTEMRRVKHPYQKGILAKKGIDF